MAYTIRARVSTTAIRQIRRDARQHPAILAKSLSTLAYHARLDEQASMRRELDRPKRFSQNAVMYQRANRRTLNSAVFVNPNNDYLHRMVYGGVRRPKKRHILIPETRLRTDASGNLSRARRRRLLRDPRKFQFRSRQGNEILAIRRGKRLMIIGPLKIRTRYKSSGYWSFHDTALKTYDRRFDRLFVQAYEQHIRR